MNEGMNDEAVYRTAPATQGLLKTQKRFAKLVMKNKYNNYDAVIETIDLESLEDRRQELALR